MNDVAHCLAHACILSYSAPHYWSSLIGCGKSETLVMLCRTSRARTPGNGCDRFFDTLYSSLNRGARAVLQIYPENGLQAESLTTAAMRAGFFRGAWWWTSLTAPGRRSTSWC